MTRDDQLVDLLMRWEDAKAAGRPLTPQALCHDTPDLLRPFTALLRRLGRLDPVLNGSAAAGTPTLEVIDAGRFTPLAFHDEGGLGVVFLAEDTEVRRAVALKWMKPLPGLDPLARRRFLQEAEITGKLEHPGVAPVYGVGHDPNGRPFYAMRYIHGTNLADAIERLHSRPATDPTRPSEFARLLRAFNSVCQTVAYAHARGVIHRDLKPGNVMLGPYGETLVVDWGLARRFDLGDADDTADTKYAPVELRLTTGGGTVSGQVIGSPAYMAPEQAAGGTVNRVGPAADVYALGATLYALLTGRTPYTGSSAVDVIEQVKRDAPPPPRKVAGGVPRPLDAICMKAMSRDPADRYATPKHLAEDIEKWFDDEPVSAYRDPLTTRARRWVKRHRTAVSAALAGLLVVGVALSVVVPLLAAKNRELTDRERELERANGELTQAFKDTDAARADAVEGWGEAEKREAKATAAYKQTADVLDAMVSGVTGESLASQVVITPEQKKFLTGVLSYYKEFAGAGGTDRQVRDRAARAASRVGMIESRLGRTDQAVAAFERAMGEYIALSASYPDSEYLHNQAVMHNNLGLIFKELGQWKGAEEHYRAGLRVCESLMAKHPNLDHPRSMAASLHLHLGGWKAALGDSLAAEREFRLALDLFQKLDAEFPDKGHRGDLADAHRNLGSVLTDLGKRDAAENSFRQAGKLIRELSDEFPQVAQHRTQLAAANMSTARLLRKYGNEREAEKLHREALDTREKLVAAYPSVPEYRGDLATQHLSLGQLLAGTGRGEAKEHFQKAVAEFTRLTTDYPKVPEYRARLAIAHGNFASYLSGAGLRAEARLAYEKCVELGDKLAKEFPGIPKYEADAATANNDFASCLNKSNQFEQAETQFRLAVTRLDKLCERQSDHPEWLCQLAESRSNLGVLLNDLGKTDAGEELLRAAMTAKETLVSDHPTIPRYRLSLSDTCVNLGYLLERTSRFPEAEKVYRKGLDTTVALVADYPQVSEYQLALARNYNGLGLSLVNQKQTAAAEKEYRNAIRLLKQLVEDSPGLTEHPVMLAASCCNLGLLVRDNGEPKESLELFDTAIGAMHPLHKQEPNHFQVVLFLRNSYWGRAEAYHRLGQFDDAVKDWDRALEFARPEYQRMFRIFKSLSAVHTDAADKAVADVGLLRERPDNASGEWYHFARIYSVASTKIAGKKDEHLDRATEMLQLAVKAGYTDVDRLTKEPDLKPLRETKAFQKLVAELEAKFPPAREVLPTPRPVRESR